MEENNVNPDTQETGNVEEGSNTENNTNLNVMTESTSSDNVEQPTDGNFDIDEDFLWSLPEDEFEKFELGSPDEKKAIYEKYHSTEKASSNEDETEPVNTSSDEHSSEKNTKDTASKEEKNTTTESDTDLIKKLFPKPIKASGKEISIDSAEEALALMQKGVDYAKKMTLIKPYQKIAKSLENAGIKDELELNFLIDVYKGNKEAVKALVKKHDIDVLEMDFDQNEYKHSMSNIVSDKSVVLDSIAEDLKTRPKFSEFTNILSTLDNESKEVLETHTHLITELYNDVESGKYAIVSGIAEKQMLLGKIPEGTPVLAAYGKALDIYNAQLEAKKAVPPVSKPTTKAKADDNVLLNILQKKQVNNKVMTIPQKSAELTNAKNIPSNDDTEFQRFVFGLSSDEFEALDKELSKATFKKIIS